MRALIVGAGTIGRWFADVTAGWLDVTFTDVDPDAAAAAADALGGTSAWPDDIDRYPVVCTAVPLSATPEVLAEHAPYAERAVIDLSGSMRVPVETLRERAPSAERISVHPLFAPENAPGNVAVVAENAGPVLETLEAYLERAGNRPFETTPEEHDRAMETVQARAHAVLVAYALTAEPVDERFHTPVSAGLDELMGIVLDGSPDVYAEIQAHFDGADSIADAATQVAEADPTTFASLYRTATDRLQRGGSDDE